MIHSETKPSDALGTGCLIETRVLWNCKILVLQQVSTDGVFRVVETSPGEA